MVRKYCSKDSLARQQPTNERGRSDGDRQEWDRGQSRNQEQGGTSNVSETEGTNNLVVLVVVQQKRQHYSTSKFGGTIFTVGHIKHL